MTIKHLCPKCQTIIEMNEKYCPKCLAIIKKRKHVDHYGNELTSTQRGYGIEWQHARMLQLLEHPFCQFRSCQEQAVEVHHIVPISEFNNPMDAHTPENLQSVCIKHHHLIHEQMSKENGKGK